MMNDLNKIFGKVDRHEKLVHADLKTILLIEDREQIKLLFDKAYKVKLDEVGNKSFFRGIIEFSNICVKDCYYCGIRKSNNNIERFMMKKEEIIDAAVWAYENNYGSMVLQSGERDDPKFVDFIEDVLYTIKEKSNGKLGITISLGEQTLDTYKRWFKAGAHRYLLRIETTNKKLYKELHPDDHDFEKRRKCLDYLKEAGYQVGTGVMIGLPGQTIDDLVNDLFFFKEQDIDMIGMGPYLVSKGTPMAEKIEDFDLLKDRQYLLALKMISAARLFLRDVNIAATTALQALKPSGREMGLMAGANIIMPNVTDTKYREQYQLYDNKPCVDEDSDLCLGCLEKRIYDINESIGYSEWGDSKHFFKRKEAEKLRTKKG